MQLQDMYDELTKRIRLSDNANKYNTLFNLHQPEDNDDNLIYWEINEKIPDLLKQIPKLDGKDKSFFIGDCAASINKVKQLLDKKGWAEIQEDI